MPRRLAAAIRSPGARRGRWPGGSRRPRCVLVGAARRQRDLYVGQRRTDQHAGVGALGKVGQNQPLPVFGQCVGRAVCRQLHAAAPRTGFQQQVDLGVMAQRLIVADALHSGGQGFVEDTALAEGDVQPEAVL